MPSELDSKIADGLVMTAVSRVWALPGDKILCTRRDLRGAILAAVQEAYSMGLLAGQETHLRESTLSKVSSLRMTRFLA